MIVTLMTAVAIATPHAPPRVGAVTTAQVRIISGAALNLHSYSVASAIAGAKVNRKAALIEFY